MSEKSPLAGRSADHLGREIAAGAESLSDGAVTHHLGVEVASGAESLSGAPPDDDHVGPEVARGAGSLRGESVPE